MFVMETFLMSVWMTKNDTTAKKKYGSWIDAIFLT